MINQLELKSNDTIHIFKDKISNQDVLEIDTDLYSKYWYIVGSEVFYSSSKENLEESIITKNLKNIFCETFESKYFGEKYTIITLQYDFNKELGLSILNNENMINIDRFSKLLAFI